MQAEFQLTYFLRTTLPGCGGWGLTHCAGHIVRKALALYVQAGVGCWLAVAGNRVWTTRQHTCFRVYN